MSIKASITIPRWQSRLLWLLIPFVVTPFVVLCFYTHPCADDWYMAVGGRDLGFWAANWKWYTEISGRIVQQATTTLHPFLISSSAYQLYCLGLLIAFTVGIFQFSSAWLRGADQVFRRLVAGTALMLFLWAMRSPAQGLYWVNGGNTYLLAGILQLFLGALLARAWHEPSYCAGKTVSITVVLLAMLASWSTELGMALQVVTMLLAATFQWHEHRRVHRLFLLALGATFAASLVIFFSPGLPVRMSTYVNEIHGHAVPALILSAKLAVKQVVIWLTSAPFFLLAMLFLGWWPTQTMTSRQAWTRICLTLLIIIGTTWGGFFVGAWSMGQSIPPRAINLLAFFFVIEWGFLIASVAALIHTQGWAKPALSPITFLLAFLALSASLSAPNNVKTAWRDLIKGDARKFDEACEQRYTLIRESKEDEVSIPPLRVKPASLFFNDLKPDFTDYRNIGMAEFFHKKAIHLTE